MNKETSYLITSVGAFIDKESKEKAIILNYAAYDKIKKIFIKWDDLSNFLGIEISQMKLEELKEICKKIR